MFDFAIADGIITLNSIEKVKLARYESEHGVPLTREDEFTLLQELQKKPPFTIKRTPLFSIQDCAVLHLPA